MTLYFCCFFPKMFFSFYPIKHFELPSCMKCAKNTTELKTTASLTSQLPARAESLRYLSLHKCVFGTDFCEAKKDTSVLENNEFDSLQWLREKELTSKNELDNCDETRRAWKHPLNCWPAQRKAASTSRRCSSPAALRRRGPARRGARGTSGCRAPGGAPCPARSGWASGSRSEAGSWRTATGTGSRRSSGTASGRPRWRPAPLRLGRFALSVWKSGTVNNVCFENQDVSHWLVDSTKAKSYQSFQSCFCGWASSPLAAGEVGRSLCGVWRLFPGPSCPQSSVWEPGSPTCCPWWGRPSYRTPCLETVPQERVESGKSLRLSKIKCFKPIPCIKMYYFML